MIDHVLIYVSDLGYSKGFYEKIFSPLGYRIAFGDEGKFWSFDIGNGALFEIAQTQGDTEISPVHIEFRAKEQFQVDSFYEAAISAGGKCNGAPGPRPQYTEGYYAAFILDPDGHNIESVYDAANHQ